MKTLLNDTLNVAHTVLLTLITFLSPIHGVVLTVISFVLFDTAFAYWRVKKMQGKWTSKKLRVGLVQKSMTYVALIVLFFLMDKYILNDFVKTFINVDFFLTKALTLIFIFIEFTSIDESYTIVRGKSIFQSLKELIGKANDIKNDLKNKNEDKF
jgi:multisubunit Na+/H+ antiporter MnhB subunit